MTSAWWPTSRNRASRFYFYSKKRFLNTDSTRRLRRRRRYKQPRGRDGQLGALRVTPQSRRRVDAQLRSRLSHDTGGMTVRRKIAAAPQESEPPAVTPPPVRSLDKRLWDFHVAGHVLFAVNSPRTQWAWRRAGCRSASGPWMRPWQVRTFEREAPWTQRTLPPPCSFWGLLSYRCCPTSWCWSAFCTARTSVSKCQVFSLSTWRSATCWWACPTCRWLWSASSPPATREEASSAKWRASSTLSSPRTQCSAWPRSASTGGWRWCSRWATTPKYGTGTRCSRSDTRGYTRCASPRWPPVAPGWATTDFTHRAPCATSGRREPGRRLWFSPWPCTRSPSSSRWSCCAWRIWKCWKLRGFTASASTWSPCRRWCCSWTFTPGKLSPDTRASLPVLSSGGCVLSFFTLSRMESTMVWEVKFDQN